LFCGLKIFAKNGDPKKILIGDLAGTESLTNRLERNEKESLEDYKARKKEVRKTGEAILQSLNLLEKIISDSTVNEPLSKNNKRNVVSFNNITKKDEKGKSVSFFSEFKSEWKKKVDTMNELITEKNKDEDEDKTRSAKLGKMNEQEKAQFLQEEEEEALENENKDKKRTAKLEKMTHNQKAKFLQKEELQKGAKKLAKEIKKVTASPSWQDYCYPLFDILKPFLHDKTSTNIVLCTMSPAKEKDTEEFTQLTLDFAHKLHANIKQNKHGPQIKHRLKELRDRKNNNDFLDATKDSEIIKDIDTLIVKLYKPKINF